LQNAAIEFLLVCNPRHGYAIAVISNYDPPSAEAIAKQVRGWLPAK
jgi:hypothetical protein